MPVVSINLSPPAYAVYENSKGVRKGSAMVSRAVLYYASRDMLHERYDRPPIEIGDLRQSVSGETIVWTKKGWEEVIDG